MAYNQNIMQMLMAQQLGQPQPQFAAPQPQAAPQQGPQGGNVSHEQAMELFKKMGAGGGGGASAGQASVPGPAASFGAPAQSPQSPQGVPEGVYPQAANFGGGQPSPSLGLGGATDALNRNIATAMGNQSPRPAPALPGDVPLEGSITSDTPNKTFSEFLKAPGAVRTFPGQNIPPVPDQGGRDFEADDLSHVAGEEGEEAGGPMLLGTPSPDKAQTPGLSQMRGGTPKPQEFQPKGRGLGGFLGDAMAGAAGVDPTLPGFAAFAGGFAGAQKHRRKLDKDEKNEFNKAADRAERRGDKAEARRIRAKKESRADEARRREKRFEKIDDLVRLHGARKALDLVGSTLSENNRTKLQIAYSKSLNDNNNPDKAAEVLATALGEMGVNPSAFKKGLPKNSAGQFLPTNRGDLDTLGVGDTVVGGDNPTTKWRRAQ